jgi:hypothetical protein
MIFKEFIEHIFQFLVEAVLLTSILSSVGA